MNLESPILRIERGSDQSEWHYRRNHQPAYGVTLSRPLIRGMQESRR